MVAAPIFPKLCAAARVTSLDAKLFAWYRLQTQYEEARARLKAAMGDGVDDGAVQALYAEVERLREEMDGTLRQLDELRRQRAQQDAPKP